MVSVSSAPAPRARHCVAIVAALALAMSAARCGGGGGGGTGGGPGTGGDPSKLPPTISSITPDAGVTGGDTLVTIRGANFRAGATVTIAGVAAAGVTISDASTITARTGARAAGTGDVVVTEDGMSATLASAFTYAVPGPSSNPAPQIAALVAKGSRKRQPERFADLSETIAITATVTDAETPADALAWAWTASAGAITGSGASVSWTAPAQAATPTDVTITLTVTERYITNDTVSPRVVDNTASQSVTISLHDSKKEVGDMATAFLVNFSQSDVPTGVVMQDFLPGCYGTKDETSDVEDNRREYRITSWTVSRTPTVTIDFAGTCPYGNRPGDACSTSDVEWHSIRLKDNAVEAVAGVDQVAAVYRNSRWWLCDSKFDGRPLTTGRTFYQMLSR